MTNTTRTRARSLTLCVLGLVTRSFLFRLARGRQRDLDRQETRPQIQYCKSDGYPRIGNRVATTGDDE
jgi:hypothetical protein